MPLSFMSEYACFAYFVTPILKRSPFTLQKGPF